LRTVRILQRLLREDRQVLRHHVSEIGSEHADIEPSAVANAQNGLGIERIREAEPWREGLQSVVNIAV
jgi:hypothetical protein